MAENKVGISGADYIIPPTADHPFWEDGDIAENLTATATVDNSTGTPSVDVTKNGYNLNFDFKNLKGEKGDPGAAGRNGEKGETGAPGKSPKVEQIEGSLGVSGVPAVNITDPENLKVAIVYNGAQGEKGDKGEKGDPGEKGEKGDTGSTGPQGPQGATGATPDISASATVDNTTGTPTVTVTKSGTIDTPTLAFAFSGIKGEKGEKGADAESVLHSFTDRLVQKVVYDTTYMLILKNSITAVFNSALLKGVRLGDSMDSGVVTQSGTYTGNISLDHIEIFTSAHAGGQFYIKGIVYSSDIDQINRLSLVTIKVNRTLSGEYIINGISWSEPDYNYGCVGNWRVTSGSAYIAVDGTTKATDSTLITGYYLYS